MADSDNLNQLQKRLTSVKAGIKDSLARQAEMEKKNLYMNWGIVVIILGFMFAGYVTVKSNFAAEAVQASLVEQGPAMVASVGEAVSEAAAEVIPVYYEEIQTKSVAVLPEAGDVFEKELSAFSEESTAHVEKQLTEALARIEKSQKANLKKLFPDLKDEEIEKLLNKVWRDTESEVEGITGYILGKTVGDIVDLDKTIKSFDTKNLPDQEHELSRLLMHNFLLVLDDELMELNLETPKTDKPEASAKPAANAKKGAK